jgi:hypothetical protein
VEELYLHSPYGFMPQCLIKQYWRREQNPVSETLCLTGRWIMSRIMIVILIYHRHKPIDSISLLDFERRRNVFSLSYGQTYNVDLIFKLKKDDE